MDMALFIFMYLCSFYLVFNSNDWFMIWLGLEINMMMFIMIVFSRYSMLNVESCYKYFFVQSLGSAIFMGLLYVNMEYLDFLMFLVLSYKVGVGPFFFWFPSICFGISWVSCFVLMVFQKLIPLVLISLFVSQLFFYFIMISLLIGTFGSFNQLNLKLLMAYSSIYHLGWILICVLISEKCWVNYMLMYGGMIMPVVFWFKESEIINLKEMSKMKDKLLLIILMLSMAGMPPFLGFFLKWFVFVNVVCLSVFCVVVMIICSVVMFYIYFRIVYDVMLGYFCMWGWGNWFMENKYSVYLEFFPMLGMMFGMLVVLFLLM